MSTNPSPLNVALEILSAKLHDAKVYHEEHDVPGEWLDEHGCLDGWENEAEHDGSQGRVEALQEAVAILEDVRDNGTVGALERHARA